MTSPIGFSDMTKQEAENEELIAEIEDLRDTLMEDNFWIASALTDGLKVASVEQHGYLAMIIYRCAKVMDCIARGDRIEDIPAHVGMAHFREFLRVQKAMVKSIDEVLDEAIKDQYDNDD